MDAFDRKLLAHVQCNNQQTHEALGEAIGLSPSAVRRLLKALRASGVIIADVALADPARLGLTVIVSVRFEKESDASYAAFKAAMRAAPEVSQCYSVSGPSDFILVAHLADLAEYERWLSQHLLPNPAIARSDAAFVYDRVKYETAVTIRMLPLTLNARDERLASQLNPVEIERHGAQDRQLRDGSNSC